MPQANALCKHVGVKVGNMGVKIYMCENGNYDIINQNKNNSFTRKLHINTKIIYNKCCNNVCKVCDNDIKYNYQKRSIV